MNAPVRLKGGPKFEQALISKRAKLLSYAISLCKKRDLAEDLVQDTMVLALSNFDKFTAGTNLEAWLFVILKNRFLTKARKAAREVEDVDGVYSSKVASPESQADQFDLDKVHQLIDTLPPEQARALRAISEGMDYESYAKQAGIATGTAKSRVSRARETVLTSLRDRSDDATVDAPSLDVRSVKAIDIGKNFRTVEMQAPDFIWVDPRTLKVEPTYQRDLSPKSLSLIRKIVLEFDWTKFKPPVCAQTKEGLYVIDGQHTAIAAASHPQIKQIPVMLVSAEAIEKRAAAFVSHNRNRLTMTPAQVFYGDVASGNRDAQATLAAVKKGGGTIPRLPVNRMTAKPGHVTAVGEVRAIYRSRGPQVLERIIRIAVLSGLTPINLTIVRGLDTLLTQKAFVAAAASHDRDIAAALRAIRNIEVATQQYAAESGQSRFRACAILIERNLPKQKAAT